MNKEEIKKELHKKSKEELIKYLLEDVNTIQYLEQKESILDKVTDKLKEDIKNDYCIKEYKSNEYRITGAKEYPVKLYAREILNIIEGENHE